MDYLAIKERTEGIIMNKKDKILILEALHIGRDAVYQDALDYHELWKGWRRKEHELMDADVDTMDRAIELMESINVGS